jgi:hypothetical protein
MLYSLYQSVAYKAIALQVSYMLNKTLSMVQYQHQLGKETTMSESSGVSLTSHKRTALEKFYDGIEYHKSQFNGALPLRVTLSAECREEMQEATALVVEGQEVQVGYRRNQDYRTVSTTKAK